MISDMFVKASLCFMALVATCAEAGDIEKLAVGIKHRVPEDLCLDRAHKDDTVHVHYTGKLLSTGEKFDSSLDRGQPFSFRVGRGHVISGWDKGVLGMCIGEKRKLKIPSEMGYGKSGSPPTIPGDADLVFDIQLLDIERMGKRLAKKNQLPVDDQAESDVVEAEQPVVEEETRDEL
eukprot:CFRG3638T1